MGDLLFQSKGPATRSHHARGSLCPRGSTPGARSKSHSTGRGREACVSWRPRRDCETAPRAGVQSERRVAPRLSSLLVPTVQRGRFSLLSRVARARGRYMSGRGRETKTGRTDDIRPNQPAQSRSTLHFRPLFGGPRGHESNRGASLRRPPQRLKKQVSNKVKPGCVLDWQPRAAPCCGGGSIGRDMGPRHHVPALASPQRARALAEPFLVASAGEALRAEEGPSQESALSMQFSVV